MKYRFTLFGFGFAVGIILVFFFLGGKKASCNWLPNDRMLNIIRSKHIEYTEQSLAQMRALSIDTLHINQILTDGTIDFAKSNVKNNPCRQYLIFGERDLKDYSIQIKLCDSVATIFEVKKP